MAGNADNLLLKVGDPGSATNLTAGYTAGATSITVASTANWTATGEGVIFAIDRAEVVNGVERQIAGTYNEYEGTVASATSITNVDWVRGAGDTDYDSGVLTRVYIPVSAERENRIVDWGLVHADQDGTLKESAVREALGLGTASTSGWEVEAELPDTITYNGNRSYDLVFNSTDLTDTLSEGMRLRLARTVSAQTQCTDLESSSSQYWNDTSVSGMTFTDDWVCGAWIKVESYGDMKIMGRYNGTSGWNLALTASGQIQMGGNNAGASNFRAITSYQSVPLGRWVHVTAQMDMSAYTLSSTTCYIMIDGVDVPSFLSQGGTNPTALIQAGNLEIGAFNSGTQPFDGKIAQAFIASAKITQANVRTLMSQGLTASLISTHSIVSAYSFDGNANDLNTTNANNLTAQGSAVATNVDSPFGNYLGGTLEYAVISSKPTFSTNTTVTVQVPEGCAIPTSGGISAVSYSTNATPYGFPKASHRWRVSSGFRVNTATTSNATYGAYASGGWTLTVPIGSWMVGWTAGYVYNATTTTVTFNISSTALTGLTLTQGNNVSPYARGIGSPSAAFMTGSMHVQLPQVHTSSATYVMYTLGATTSASIEASQGGTEIFAEFGLI